MSPKTLHYSPTEEDPSTPHGPTPGPTQDGELSAEHTVDQEVHDPPVEISAPGPMEVPAPETTESVDEVKQVALETPGVEKVNVSPHAPLACPAGLESGLSVATPCRSDVAGKPQASPSSVGTLSSTPGGGDGPDPSEPIPGELRISQNAINLRMHRMMKVDAKGNSKVSSQIREQFHTKKGKLRLQQLFQSCGYHPERVCLTSKLLLESFPHTDLWSLIMTAGILQTHGDASKRGVPETFKMKPNCQSFGHPLYPECSRIHML